MSSPSFARWLGTFLAEKGIDPEEVLEVEGPSGPNAIPIGCLVEAMDDASRREQEGIRTMLVRIDFRAGDVRAYLAHLAKAIAV